MQARNRDNSYQLGIAILLEDNKHNATLIYYASWKYRRITGSALAAEVYAFAAGFDYAINLAHDVSDILGRDIPVMIFTDSKCLFDTITKSSPVSEKRLLIDISALREAYNSEELTNVAHVESK